MKNSPCVISAFRIRHLDERRVVADAGIEVALHLLEQRLERLEVLARLAIGDLLGGALVGARADMAQLGDVVGARRARQLGQQLVIVDGSSVARRRLGAPSSKP